MRWRPIKADKMCMLLSGMAVTGRRVHLSVSSGKLSITNAPNLRFYYVPMYIRPLASLINLYMITLNANRPVRRLIDIFWELLRTDFHLRSNYI